MNISVIDMGNIFNLQRAISFVGGQSSIIRNIDDIFTNVTNLVKDYPPPLIKS